MFRRFRNYPQIGGKRGGIPADCVEVEWLKGDRKAVIDTGIVASSELSVEVSYSGAYYSNTESVCGAIAPYNGVTNRHSIQVQRNGVLIYINTETPFSQSATGTSDATVLYDARKNIVLVNGSNVAVKTKKQFLLPVTYALFARHNGSMGNFTNMSACNISKAHLWDLNNEVYLVPVRRTTDGLGYMCDTLTGKLYGNAGTGAFIIGPDK